MKEPCDVRSLEAYFFNAIDASFRTGLWLSPCLQRFFALAEKGWR